MSTSIAPLLSFTIAMFLAVAFFSLMGAVLYRFRGMDEDVRILGRPIPQMLFALPYMVVYPLSQFTAGEGLSWLDWAITAAVGVCTTVAVCMAHGQYFPQLAMKYIKPERLDFLLRPFFGDDPRSLYPGDGAVSQSDQKSFFFWICNHYGLRKLKWRCFAGMALTGLLITLPAGIATLNPFLALSGALKAIAYAGPEKTEKAELYTGAFLWLSLLLSVGWW